MKLSHFFSREHFIISVREILTRFPQAALVSLALTLYLLYKIITDNTSSQDEYIIFRVVTTLILTFFLSLGTSLFYESIEKNMIDRKFPILPIVYGIIFYTTVKFGTSYGIQGMTLFLLHLTGFVAFAFFLPYLGKLFHIGSHEREVINIEYTNYFSRVSWVFLMSGIVGISLFVLGAIAISAVVSLFELSSLIDEGKYYGSWATLSLALIAPFYGLSEFPGLKNIEQKTFETNRFFSFLVRFVATPAVYIYFIILYAYSFKVLANFTDWPRGMISWLVIGFSSFGYLTFIFSKSYETESSSIRLFRRWFPLVVIPQLFMLFYAIGLRIGQYDLTMKRYFVVAFGIWLFIVSIYFLIRKAPLLAFIPALLALVSFVISIGPWGVFSYPFARQEARLMRNLLTANILQNGKIVPLQSERDITKELSTDIASEIDYLCDFDNCARIRELFPDQTRLAEERSLKQWESWNIENTGAVYPGAYSYEITSTIVNELKVQQYSYNDMTQEFPEQEYLYYNVDYQVSQFPLSITGYDRIVVVMNMADTKFQNTSLTYPYITVNPDTSEVSYYTASGVARTFPLKIPEKFLDSATFSTVPKEDLTFDIGDNTMSLRLVLQSLSVKNPRYIPKADTNTKNTAYIGGINGLALIKEKK